jgi:hypothetical protein
MYAKQNAVCVSAFELLIVSFATYSAQASQAEDKSAQDQSKAEAKAKAASDIKSAPSDEGQLATGIRSEDGRDHIK